ncbi:Zn-dependent exopeptidase [Guyanagaster necrorhizus]|uniref:Zn-dependent exopeptidase n=1 Tax=Guyanagaster necrorhizus TaxID=856835 RepID=A0A9P7VI46_9AGAR|nr:Zn-dependent exopeptidase [Guyanagaster necrorhizus MCA 3950]KAG7440790.1 Zn-dependent exopeptidase [Guyanagaster necrorhizus MCA 3950]
MADEKSFYNDSKAIPAPATTSKGVAARRWSIVKLVLALCTVVVVLHSVLRPLHLLDVEHPKKYKPLVGKRAENVFLSVPNEEACIATSRHYTAEPHLAGSTTDLSTAKDFLHFLQTELGVQPPTEDPIFPAGSPESQSATLSIPKTFTAQAWIDVYYPVMNTPLDRAVQALDPEGNVIWDADLTEHAGDTDPEAGEYYDFVPTFHGLSKGGDVTGKLVYANYGLKEDYDALIAKGVNLTGSIILARYGGNFRGLKVKGAQEVGAAGILIYSDIRDDGVVTVENGYKPYPDGPARSPTSVQRGSVQFISMYPGDPTTPGYPSYENVTRTEALNSPSIPSLPFSWANAQKLLDLAETGEINVRLVNHVDDRVIPIWNTMAVIPGFITDEIVVVGNHRDAWVMGAADPTSGTASIAETIRGFGVLMRKGWKPLRTIVIASWDAEEYGLIGSTEWGEDFAEFIDKYVVAYVNLDVSVGGSRYSAQASPLLAHLVQQTALDIPHPTDKDRTLWDATKDTGTYFGARKDGETVIDPDVVARSEAHANAVDALGVGVLGSGSDYTVFLQRLGISSTNGGFGQTINDPVYHYHSVYDSERWMELYGDPGFFRHTAVAKHLGLQVLRLADNVVLPFNTTHYSYELENYLDNVENLVSAQSVDIDLSPLRQSIHSLQAASLALDYEKLAAERNIIKVIKKWRKEASKMKKLKKKLRKAYCKVRKALGHPCEPHRREEQHQPAEEERRVHHAGFEHRIGRLPAWRQEVAENEMLYGIALQAGFKESRRGCVKAEIRRFSHFPIGEMKEAVKCLRAVNQKLVTFERGFISEDGIPEREWFKHLGVAPGKWLGYGATTLPALTESITIDGNATLAKYEAARLKDLLDNLVEKIKA